MMNSVPPSDSDSRMMVFAGNANPRLAQSIAGQLRLNLGDAHVKSFSDGEVQVEIMENVRGKDVFIVQPTCAPTNDNLMELLIMSDALRRSSAPRITAVIPFLAYARQDRKSLPREPITARLISDLFVTAGADRLDKHVLAGEFGDRGIEARVIDLDVRRGDAIDGLDCVGAAGNGRARAVPGERQL